MTPEDSAPKLVYVGATEEDKAYWRSLKFQRILYPSFSLIGLGMLVFLVLHRGQLPAPVLSSILGIGMSLIFSVICDIVYRRTKDGSAGFNLYLLGCIAVLIASTKLCAHWMILSCALYAVLTLFVHFKYKRLVGE